MPQIEVNGVGLHYELQGSGDPLVLVHGSWSDATGWGLVAPALAASWQVLTYDRRGHSRSEAGAGPGSADQDGDDLAALIEALGLAPAHVVTSSFGGNIALRLATRRPELFRSLTCHEPPLFALLAGDPESEAMLQQSVPAIESVGRRIAEGDHEGAARQFADEIAFGPGAWETQLTEESKATMVRNAPTFLDELQDPNQGTVDTDALAGLEAPLSLTEGSDSPRSFRACSTG